jgi:hypothetical protein
MGSVSLARGIDWAAVAFFVVAAALMSITITTYTTSVNPYQPETEHPDGSNQPLQVVTDDDGNYTPYIDIHYTPADVTLRLMVPAPPAGWDPFGSAPATTTPDTKGKGGGAIAAVIPPVES